ncbi:hypothetical protein GODINES_54 [Mycobacterium phage Godines]|uniref:Uncharacterized protein n=1 Tax=Mycobacterium phage Godines TaxID=1675551 RepID=A0A0K1LSV4_9CAUD|nr:hypothetical protein FDI79_gp54 [Mycobacterium phage Godines]AKU45253.1 hypothetical protein GODINES_54 [Mycobacterium phage Godines]
MATAPTSITFDKKALIKAANAALDVHDKANVEYRRRCAAYIAENTAPSKRDNIVALRDALSAFIKTKRTPTLEDTKRFRAAAGSDYLSELRDREVSENEVRNNVPRPEGWLNATTVGSYRGLVAMLNAHTGDTVTANQLKLFGYTNLEGLFRAAATIAPEAVR